jgi:hypothetical protein
MRCDGGISCFCSVLWVSLNSATGNEGRRRTSSFWRLQPLRPSQEAQGWCSLGPRVAFLRAGPFTRPLKSQILRAIARYVALGKPFTALSADAVIGNASMITSLRTLLLLPFVLCGCELPKSFNPMASESTQAVASTANLAWARKDARLISDSPALTARARTDISECLAAIPPVRTDKGIAGEKCMNERGYYVRDVP